MADAKKEKKIETKDLNVYQKLELARYMFAQQNITKGGVNMNMGYTYFELSDIVPVATNIFHELGLVLIQPNVTGTGYKQVLAHLINIDKPEDRILFHIPYTPIEPIISNSGKKVTNDIQATGASITYIRRYIYMIVLDIVEHDAIDSGEYDVVGQETTASKPATPQERQNAKATLTQESKATELQTEQLRATLSKLKDTGKLTEEQVQTIMTQTNGLANITTKDWEALMSKLSPLLGGDDK